MNYYDDLPHGYDADNIDIEFTTRFAMTVQNHIPKSTALAIGKSIFARMNDARLHYHTTVHILAILDFAKMHDIKLELWEELIIWFHDVIYEPTISNGQNEVCSAKFMQACLTPYFDDEIIDNVFEGIIMTSKHLNDCTPKQFDKILDLDLCSFASETTYKKTTKLIRKEYPDTSDEEFQKGRNQFLIKLITGRSIYRSEFFKEKFEAKARENIKKDLI